MRITGGAARGIQLDVPQQNVRPATDYMRESVFNRLGGAIVDKVVLDCFAGTGAYGLEALSRGAQICYFLEKNPKVITSLKKNCERVLKSAQRDILTAKIISTDLFCFSPSKIGSVDYVFFDPPYPYWTEKLLEVLSILEMIARTYPQALFIIEHPVQLKWPSEHPLSPIDPLKPSKKKNAPSIHFFKTDKERLLHP